MTSATEPLAIIYDLLILGAGAAGLMAAVGAGEASLQGGESGGGGKSRLRMAILEKNVQAGLKILVCGGGRCNLTNAGDIDFLIAQFGRNGRFLSPALRHLSNEGLRDWFTAQGVPTHEEHDGKIYPDSNQARSVVDALLRRTRELGVDIFTGLNAVAQSLQPDAQGFRIATADGRLFSARCVVLALGGQSYTRMGTTGDGYRMAAALGHTVITPRPAIVALLCKEEWPKTLQGLAVPDVEVRIEAPGPLPRLATGKPTPSVNDLLFTHFGLSGPAVLNPSEIVAELLEKFPTVTLRIDFVRHDSHEGLRQRLHRWQQEHGRKQVTSMLAQLVPQRLAEALAQLCSVFPQQTCSHLSAGQIHQLVEALKSSRCTIFATRGFKEAMVTAGGVALPEVHPNTLESKRVPGLYIVGEMLDLTGPSGGYNLQLAFSTGHLAGVKAAEKIL